MEYYTRTISAIEVSVLGVECDMWAIGHERFYSARSRHPCKALISMTHPMLARVSAGELATLYPDTDSSAADASYIRFLSKPVNGLTGPGAICLFIQLTENPLVSVQLRACHNRESGTTRRS